jgi:hypothetical protein
MGRQLPTDGPTAAACSLRPSWLAPSAARRIRSRAKHGMCGPPLEGDAPCLCEVPLQRGPVPTPSRRPQQQRPHVGSQRAGDDRVQQALHVLGRANRRHVPQDRAGKQEGQSQVDQRGNQQGQHERSDQHRHCRRGWVRGWEFMGGALSGGRGSCVECWRCVEWRGRVPGGLESVAVESTQPALQAASCIQPCTPHLSLIAPAALDPGPSTPPAPHSPACRHPNARGHTHTWTPTPLHPHTQSVRAWQPHPTALRFLPRRQPGRRGTALVASRCALPA